MKNILVTGGAGFLGSNLCGELLKRGNKVVCLDNFYTSKMDNIKKLANDKNFIILNGDVRNPYLNLSSFCFDEIYNLACPASPIHYQKDPIFTFETNVTGMTNALNLANNCSAKILQASTSEVYGDALVNPQKEDYWGNVNPDGIRSCYDEGKRSAETLCFDYNRMFNTKIKVVRIFNTYGVNMNPDDGRVVSNFIVQALKGNPITVYGTGEQTRSFCYVSDLISGFLKMMETDDSIKGPINLGNPEEFSMLELAEKVIRKTNSSSKIIFEKLPDDDPKQRKPDIYRAKNILNWEPKISLDEGLDRTIEYFKSL